MIENIKGYAHEIEELEELTNDFIARSRGKLIKTVNYPTELFDNRTGRPISTQRLIYIVEYDSHMKTWQELYNKITFDVLEREDVLTALFVLDDPNISEHTLKRLVDSYKGKSMVDDLCRLNNIEFKESE